MFDLFVPCLLGIGTASTGCAIYFSLKDWADDKTKALRDWQSYAVKIEAEVERLDQENDALRADVRSALCRELAWLSERKLLNARVNFAVQEMAMDDPNKKTTVFRPE